MPALNPLSNSITATSQSVVNPSLIGSAGLDFAGAGSIPAVSGGGNPLFAGDSVAQKTFAQLQLELLRATTMGNNPYLSLLCYSAAAAAASTGILPPGCQPTKATSPAGINTSTFPQLQSAAGFASKLAGLSGPNSNNMLSIANLLGNQQTVPTTNPQSFKANCPTTDASSLAKSNQNPINKLNISPAGDKDFKLAIDQSKAQSDFLLAPVITAKSI